VEEEVMKGGVRRIVLILGRGDGIPLRVLKAMGEEARRGYRDFELHVFTSMGRPDYMEDVRDIILNNIAYGLRVWYHGASVEKLRRLVSENPKPLIIVDETADPTLVRVVEELAGRG
jgi:hypothetical protein